MNYFAYFRIFSSLSGALTRIIIRRRLTLFHSQLVPRLSVCLTAIYPMPRSPPPIFVLWFQCFVYPYALHGFYPFTLPLHLIVTSSGILGVYRMCASPSNAAFYNSPTGRAYGSSPQFSRCLVNSCNAGTPGSASAGIMFVRNMMESVTLHC